MSAQSKHNYFFDRRKYRKPIRFRLHFGGQNAPKSSRKTIRKTSLKMTTTLGPVHATHVLKKKAETEIPPPFDVAVPVLTDSRSIFAPFWRPVASLWRHFGTPWLPVGLPKGVPGPSYGFILVPVGLPLASMDGSLEEGPEFVPFFML